MKHNQKSKTNGNTNAHGGNGRRSKAQRVEVEFAYPTASSVAIAGTFNNWHPETSPLSPVGDGKWATELVLPPGTYEYLFVADGQWLADPAARETVPNPFGGKNSLLRVPHT